MCGDGRWYKVLPRKVVTKNERMESVSLRRRVASAGNPARPPLSLNLRDFPAAPAMG